MTPSKAWTSRWASTPSRWATSWVCSPTRTRIPRWLLRVSTPPTPGDAHIEAGQDRPIEVTIGKRGSQLSLPVFKVQDWGTGLSREDIEQIYSQYGASTKRGSNDAVGMLGIGCKSALAYTDQFIVTSVKGGELIVVSVALDENGRGTMTVLEMGDASDRPDGTTVEIPMKADNEMLHKAEWFFRFWERGTVLLNGVEPTPIWEHDDAYELTDSITVVPVDPESMSATRQTTS